MPDNVIRVGASFDVTPVTAGATLAADSIETATARMNTAFNRVGPAWEKATHEMAFSTTEAKHALHGLGEEIGVHIPRFVQGFVANLGGVGPALAMAFTPIAIVGLIGVLSEIPDAIDKGINKLQGWTEAAKKAFSEATADAIKFEHETIKLNEEVAKIGLIGKKGVEKYNLEMAIAVSTTDELKQLQAKYSEDLENSKRQMEMLEEQTKLSTLAGKALFTSGYEAFGGMMLKIGGAGKTIEQDKIKVEELTKSMHALSTEIAHRESVEKPTIGAEQIEAAKEAAKKYQDTLEQIYSTETKLTQEGAAKELASMERVRAERERNDEEIARGAEASYKKDLDSFDRSVTGKTRLIEEQGRNELEQIRANTAMQEKVTASTSARGAGDPRISAEALSGYQQEVALIQQMIVEEEKLKAVLEGGGADEQDPKMLESMAREQQMVQQLQVAWQKYQQTVENVNANQYKTFEKALTGMTQSFNQNFMSWVNGTETFGRAMQHVWTSLADTVISSLMKAGEQMIANVALQKSLLDGTKITDASAAARHTYASVSAIPFIGPFLAPEAAAVAFAAVMAFEKGGIVPRTDIAQLHKGEMVLPAHISQSVQKMAESGQGGGHTFNYNPTVHGSSAGGIKDILEQHGKQFVDYAMKELRRKNLS